MKVGYRQDAFMGGRGMYEIGGVDLVRYPMYSTCR